ncbi:KamA family radical SAM protein [Hippea sp. KM1]|uniref:KamA family radical SAM protein n=1 Tax=Hippea sp. KM1 TaxID=944481 RepID=UPI00046CCC84|nr:KamA family radical SAM protein [Hippea sp. KM1]
MDAKLNDYLCGLIHKKGIKGQFYFSKRELFLNGSSDPLNEKDFSKAKGLIHRYPDRVVLTITNKCFAYCRFCFRKDNWRNFGGFDLDRAASYIQQNRSIREVLISGGDPFFLSNDRLKQILTKIRAIKHIKFIRIGTRVLTSYPMRIDEQTIQMLTAYKPIWLAIHINHPDEITHQFKEAAKRFIDNGFPIVSQTVLLKGLNDDVFILEKLFCRLTELNIKPYYLFGCDQAKGNNGFRVPIEKALSIMERLRGSISGLCVPNFAFDLPEGMGKVVVEPNRIIKKQGNIYRFRNFEGKEIEYIDV